MLATVLRSAASVARKVLRLPMPARPAGQALFADEFAATVTGRGIWLTNDDLDERRYGRPPVLSETPARIDDALSSAPALVTAEPAASMEPTVSDVDHDTPENRLFARTHPRHAHAREAAFAFILEKGAPAGANEIADHVRGPGGVPEFRVPVKSLSNRLVTFGLVKAKVDGKVVWSLPEA